ncbi:MAG: hypothetical protein K6B52_07100 [Clostridiales bacterium]|nr:hypothetical protein [Clostridiales bacterium]
MTIHDIKELLDARVCCGEEILNRSILSACASDMMSDVLAFAKNQAILVTGLMNPQVIRTAEMMDMKCIVFVRSKMPSDEMVNLAESCSIVLLSTDMLMFETCGVLFTKGLIGKGDTQ